MTAGGADRIRLKVCCIASVDEAQVATRFGADAVGLVGAMPSGPGPIADELIAEIAAAVPPSVATFLLTQETSLPAIVDHARRTGTSTLQLVDWVEPSVHRQLRRELLGIKLVQVLHVQDDSVLDQAQAAAATVDALLLDSGRPDAEPRQLGGTGRTHDWRLSRRVVEASPVPVFLAGGLDADNVAEAIARVRPFGVDVCRGVRADGQLNAGQLRAFVSAVNAAPRL
jgi:phosphoribosylanthranilate isomerase